MERKNFWNDAAKYGAIIGAVLALSTLFEQYATLSGRMSIMSIMVLEYIAVVVLHYVLLHRYTKRYAASFPVSEGFPFGKAYGYILLLSGFAGVIVGLVQTVYLHLVMGYEAYRAAYIEAMQHYLSQSSVPASMEPLLSQLFGQLESMPAPSVLQTAWGSVWSTLLFGALFGLIIAGVLSRAPKPFAENENE